MDMTDRQNEQVWKQVAAYEAQVGVETVSFLLGDKSFQLEVPPLVADPAKMNSGLQVVDFLAKRPEIVRGKSVVDMGTGCGIIGIAAGKLGAKIVYMPEIDEDAMFAAMENARNNGATNCCALQSDLFSIFGPEFNYSPSKPGVGIDVQIFNHPFFVGEPLPDKEWTRMMLGGTRLLGRYFMEAPRISKPETLYILPWLPLAGNPEGFDNDPGRVAPDYGYDVIEMAESLPVEQGLQQEPFVIYVLRHKG